MAIRACVQQLTGVTEVLVDYGIKWDYSSGANSERAEGRAFLLEVVMKFYKK